MSEIVRNSVKERLARGEVASSMTVRLTRGIEIARLAKTAGFDSLYIDLSQRPSVESQEVSEGVVLDYDGEGNLVGIDIDHASRKLDLRELVTSHIPLRAKAKA